MNRLKKPESLHIFDFVRWDTPNPELFSALLIEKSSTNNLIKEHSNLLIRAARPIDEAVIEMDALERWQQLKVHRMPLARYLREEKMKLLCCKIESSTGIKLKTSPRWLINKAQLKERLQSGNGRGSAIVIIVGNGTEASEYAQKGWGLGGLLNW